MEVKPDSYLTADQVYQLNEKHGWFQSGDAQSDVSSAFAQDAIAMHERMRTAAPYLLAALQKAAPYVGMVRGSDIAGDDPIFAVMDEIAAAIAKATGAAS